jgi:catechol 2,3-dioxygenase-like lactoylglutathione lyase family enzyme
MLGDADLVAFVPTRDLTVAKQFYEQVLGLRVVDESEFAVVYEANGIRLRVARVDQVTIAPYTVLGWRVDNIAARLAMLRRAGVTPKRYDGMQQDEDGIWTAPSGTRVAWFSDPDGNTLSLEQPPPT